MSEDLSALAGVPFAKGHGTHNDFVILPDPDGTLPLTAARVAALCDRRGGIGGDGLLRVVRCSRHPDAVRYAGEAEWFMDYWNADGSIAEMCGNGIRVYLRYLLAAGLAGGDKVTVATRSGPRTGLVGPDAIAVDMGTPRLLGTTSATIRAEGFPGVAVDAGNPHLVCPLRTGDTAGLAALDLTRAPGVDAGIFPSGANVEFVTELPDPAPGADRHAAMRVYERGAAETASCGSGAVAAAAVILREADRDSGTVAIDVPGGRLTATLTHGSCRLAGPAEIIATGTLV
jgi:diaminopimelate epimerase